VAAALGPVARKIHLGLRAVSRVGSPLRSKDLHEGAGTCLRASVVIPSTLPFGRVQAFGPFPSMPHAYSLDPVQGVLTALSSIGSFWASAAISVPVTRCDPSPGSPESPRGLSLSSDKRLSTGIPRARLICDSAIWIILQQLKLAGRASTRT